MISTRGAIAPDIQTEFDRLAILEPRLNDVLKEADAVVDGGTSPSFCANEVFYGYAEPAQGLKRRISSLVGHSAQAAPHPDLKTSEAYDVVYEVVYKALPDCRNCMCA